MSTLPHRVQSHENYWSTKSNTASQEVHPVSNHCLTILAVEPEGEEGVAESVHGICLLRIGLIIGYRNQHAGEKISKEESSQDQRNLVQRTPYRNITNRSTEAQRDDISNEENVSHSDIPWSIYNSLRDLERFELLKGQTRLEEIKNFWHIEFPPSYGEFLILCVFSNPISSITDGLGQVLIHFSSNDRIILGSWCGTPSQSKFATER